jgi:hypothetical protein
LALEKPGRDVMSKSQSPFLAPIDDKSLPVVRITQLSLPVMGNKKVSELEVPKA